MVTESNGEARVDLTQLILTGPLSYCIYYTRITARSPGPQLDIKDHTF